MGTGPFIVAVAFFAFVTVTVIGPLGRALADRLSGRARQRVLEAGEAEATQLQLEAVQGQVSRLEQQLAELSERQEFTERMLAEVKKKALPAGGSGA